MKLIYNLQCLLSTAHAISGTGKAINLFACVFSLQKCLNITDISAEKQLRCLAVPVSTPACQITKTTICTYLNINSINKTLLRYNSDQE